MRQAVFKSFLLTCAMFLIVLGFGIQSTYSLDVHHSVMLRSGVGAMGTTDTIAGVIDIAQTVAVPIGLSYGVFLDKWIVQTGLGYKSGIRVNLKNPIIGEQTHLGFWDIGIGYTFNRNNTKEKGSAILWQGLMADISLGFNEVVRDISFGASLLLGKDRWYAKIGGGATKYVAFSRWGGYANLGVGFII